MKCILLIKYGYECTVCNRFPVRKVTFQQQGLNAVRRLELAVKASLSQAINAAIVKVPYYVRPKGDGHIRLSKTPPPPPCRHNCRPLLYGHGKLPPEPLLWCKSQVGEQEAWLMHRHCAVKSLLTLPMGDSRKRDRVKAVGEERSDKTENRVNMNISGHTTVPFTVPFYFFYFFWVCL